MNDDASLLRQYTEKGSEEAFTELVRRYVDLVYGAAMRRTGGNAHLSSDVAQQVFASLARKANRLAPETALGAWLYTATRNAAINLMISEHRRRRREAQALALNAPGEIREVEPNWAELAPLLDAAIDELPESDRTSLVFRFFERRPFSEIGARLSISEDAARKRTERTLEKLRLALARRGVASTAAALAAVVSSQPLTSAPATLAVTLAAQALAATPGVGAFASTLLSLMTAKIATVASLSAIIAFVLGTYVGVLHPVDRPPPPAVEAARLSLTIASLTKDNHDLKEEVATLTTDLANLKVDYAALNTARLSSSPSSNSQSKAGAKSPTLGLARYEVQQAVLNNLRQIASARDQFWLENGRAPESVDKLVGRGKYLKTVRTVGGEGYAELPMKSDAPLTVTTPDGITVTLDPSGRQSTKPDIPPEIAKVQELQQRTEPARNKALAAFRAANNGSTPTSNDALLPFFTTPQEGADFVELIEAAKAADGK